MRPKEIPPAQRLGRRGDATNTDVDIHDDDERAYNGTYRNRDPHRAEARLVASGDTSRSIYRYRLLTARGLIAINKHMTNTNSTPGQLPAELNPDADSDRPVRYWIQQIDSDRPSAWMSLVTLDQAASGRKEGDQIQWYCHTYDPEALEAALDADPEVLQYGVDE